MNDFKTFLLCVGLLLLAAIVGVGYYGQQITGSAQAQSSNTDGSAWSITSAPQLSAAQLDTILAAYHSPMAGLGQDIYSAGLQYQISSDFAMAFWLHESTLGTAGEATTTFSPGNLRCVPDRACADQQRGGYAQMLNWKDGIEHWYMLIKDGYVGGQVSSRCPCTTIPQIIPVYAPTSDHNNETAYIQALVSTINAWRSGKVVLS